MKRAFVIITVLAIILSLSCGVLVAQEREREGEVREREEARRVERRPDPDRRMEQEERMRDRPEALYDKLFAELRRQRDEIRALREEVAALRRMLEDQFALRRARQVRRGRELPRRWEPEREPERREPERREIPDDINREIMNIRERLERRPDDIELRMRLAHLYREIDRIEAAIEQYKQVLKIAPDFDAPYQALRELGYRFPDEPREEEVPLKDSAGEVISSSEKEVKVKTREGDVVTFTVPSWQRDDGSWALNEDLSEMAKSLDPGAQVKILWQEHEGLRVIQRMEKIEKGDVER